ncbi:MAG: Na+/H+ antiporter [Actinomycetota bacterium]|jgi:CPA1 family monovalent cation:H+ antiporter|nr:Na+/H+ antiporter [Actinomycetota bacterium]
MSQLAALVPGLDPVTSTYLFAGLGIAVVVVASRTLSRWSRVPYPVFLVVAGALASFMPGLGPITLEPRVVFLGFLPPLVYHAGLVTSPRELRANALPIGLGALGLVLATTMAVAAVVWALVPSFGWVGAFVLGAVVAPTDVVAAVSVFNRLGAPPRVTTVLEGESLVNDGIALALFGIGVAAVAAPMGIGSGLAAFVRVAGGGVAFGLVVGWVASRSRRPLRDSASQIVVSLLVPFAAYLPADALGLSGVLATLTTGLVLGQQPSSELDPSGRVQMSEFWQVLVFLLESVLFVLVGFQLRQLVAGIRGYPLRDVVFAAVLGSVVVVVVRLAWWMAIPTLRWRPEGRIIDTGDVPWQQRLALGWSGLRGAISLAAALSVPVAVSGHLFPDRDLLIFTTFCVIVVTLVGQGTSLPWLLRRLSIGGDDLERHQRVLAERRCAEAALRLLDQLSAEEEISDDLAELLRRRYERRLDQARVLAGDGASGAQPTLRSLRAVEAQVLSAQHEALRDLHRSGEISFTVMRAVRRDLDLDQARSQV